MALEEKLNLQEELKNEETKKSFWTEVKRVSVAVSETFDLEDMVE